MTALAVAFAAQLARIKRTLWSATPVQRFTAAAAPLVQAPVRVPTAEHGTLTRYNHDRCRCELCCETHLAYMRRWQAKRKHQGVTRDRRAASEDVSAPASTPKLEGNTLAGLGNAGDGSSRRPAPDTV